MQVAAPAWHSSPPTPAPPLSVVMPVRNAMPYLDQAVQSILAQTFRQFEFVIVDDGSTDGSWERLQQWAARDDRIRLVRSPFDPGPVTSSNYAVTLSRGELVARMDADDLAHPHRLERQLKTLAAGSDIVLVGTLWNAIDSSGKVIRSRDRSQIGSRKLRAPFCHGSILFRRAAFDMAGGYRDRCAFWEDTDLYFRLAKLGRILVLPDALYAYRFSNSSTRLTSNAVRVQQAVDLYFRCSDALASEQAYEDVLFAPTPSSGAKLTLRTFGALAAMQIWSGRRPRLLRQALAHCNPPRSVAELASILFICAGNLHPGPVRVLLRKQARYRDWISMKQVKDGLPVEWYWSRRQSGLRDLAQASGARSETFGEWILPSPAHIPPAPAQALP